MKPNSAEKSEFFLLFDEHWEAGTGRPPLRKVRYEYWLPGEFLNQLENCGCRVSEDTLANWRNGKAVPREPAFKAILSVFFPTGPSQSQPQPEVNTDREKMRRAYEKAKAERQRQPKPTDPAPASKAKAGPAAADFAGPAAEPATVGSQPTAAIRAQETTLSPDTTVLVVTALPVEAKSVLARLTEVRSDKRSATWVRVGQFGAFTVVVIEVGPGNPAAASVAAAVIEKDKPGVAAFIGIAGGIKDVKIGDVVVATKVYGYESGKEYAEGFRPRPDVRSSDYELVQRARIVNGTDTWRERLNPSLWSGNNPNAFVAPIAAGEAVVGTDKGRIASFLQQFYGDALAVEMEGRGFLEAVHISPGCRGVVVRGITDLLTGKAEAEATGSQARAADSAAAFFFAMLALEPDPKPGLRKPTASEQQSDQQKLARLKLIVADILSKSPAAMEALAEQISDHDIPVAPETDPRISAKVLIDHLMAANLKTSTDWLTAAHMRLENTLNRDAVETIEKVSQHVLPWILVLDPQFRGANALPLSTGAIIPIQVGAESLAVVVLAGIAACRAEFSKGAQTQDRVTYPVSPYTLQPVRVQAGPHNLIIPHLRSQLMERLGITTAYAGRSHEEIDDGIKLHLETYAKHKNVHWHYILVMPKSPAEWPALRGVWAEVIKKYEYLSVIEVDPNLIAKHDRVWNSLRLVFGLLGG